MMTTRDVEVHHDLQPACEQMLFEFASLRQARWVA